MRRVVGDSKLASIRALAAAGRTAAEIAAQLRTRRDTITLAARKAGISLVRPGEAEAAARVERVRELAAQGLLATEIAEAMGCSKGAVHDIAYRHRIAIRRMTSQERAARSHNVRTRGPVRVPDWVSADLRGEYRDLAADLGAAWADQTIRKLMEDARAP